MIDKNFNPLTFSATNGITYDLELHTWVLTIDEISDKFDDDLIYMMKTEKRALAFLRELSTQVDDYAKSLILNNSRPIYTYLNAHSADRAIAFKQALLRQYRYARVSGGNLIEAQSGINPKTGIVIDPNTIEKMVVSAGVKKSLEVNGLVNPRLVYTIPTTGTSEYGVDY